MHQYFQYFYPDGRSPRGYIWEDNKPKKCESCKRETNELYCCPIGNHNWRCRQCQINLIEHIGYEDCLENQNQLYSYPLIPDGYVSPNFDKEKYEHKKKKEKSLWYRVWNWRKFTE